MFVLIFGFIFSVVLFSQETIDGYVGEFLVVLGWWVARKCSGLGLGKPLTHYIFVMLSLQCLEWIHYSLMKSKYEIHSY